MIKTKKFVVNPLGENSYLLADETGQCIFIDPGFYYEEEHSEITGYINANGLIPVKIVNTHCHFDHLLGVEFIRKKYNIPFAAHEKESPWVSRLKEQAERFGVEAGDVSAIDEYISESDIIRFGNSELEVIHVPGHAQGHLVFYSSRDQVLFAGDVLFYGSIGRTDLPGGHYETLIEGIRRKLLVLPGETRVYCGHGPETTIAFEKEHNPFLT